MRKAARTDANHSAIVQALRDAGCTVQSLAAIGSGCPDILLGVSGRTALLEVKDGSKKPSARALTPEQLRWHAAWRGGTLAVVCDVEGALRVARLLRGLGGNAGGNRRA